MTSSKVTIPSLNVRLARSTGRTGRDRMANARVTAKEQQELHDTARAQGKSLGEWAREILLREARRSDQDPLFTELIATRMILLNLLKASGMGQVVTPDDFARISATVRNDKRRVAQEIQQQYLPAVPKEA